MPRSLAVPKNLRGHTPHVCGTCALLSFSNPHIGACIRPNGPYFEVGDGQQYYTTCDGWRAEPLATNNPEETLP